MYFHILFNFAEPFVVSFEDTIYEVNETAGQVEICVILISPTIDVIITPEEVGVEVYGEETNEHFPEDAAIASEQITSEFICILA